MHGFDPLLPAPAIARFQFVLQAFHVPHLFGRGVMRKLRRRLVILGQQIPQSIQPTGDDLEGSSGGIHWQFLRQRGHTQTGLAPSFAAVGLNLAGQQAKQGGFTGAVATDQADPLAGVDLEAGAIQQFFGTEGDGEVVDA